MRNVNPHRIKVYPFGCIARPTIKEASYPKSQKTPVGVVTPAQQSESQYEGKNTEKAPS